MQHDDTPKVHEPTHALTEQSASDARELLDLVEDHLQRPPGHYEASVLMAAIYARGLRDELSHALTEMPANSSDFVQIRNWVRTLWPLPGYMVGAAHRHLNLAQPITDLEHWRQHRRGVRRQPPA